MSTRLLQSASTTETTTEPDARDTAPQRSNSEQAALAAHTRGKRQLQFKRAQGDATPTAKDVAIAERGVGGAGGPLPSAERIGQSYGVDLGGVSAHTGPQARASCEALGAEAYTVGDKIAFRDQSPSLALQAHEAAHVVQQGAAGQRTVDRKSTDKVAGSDHEQQADNAADRVVAGGTANLEASSAPPVQRFAPEGHEEATSEGLKGRFTAEEIGLIYQSNWERDFSQGTGKIADAAIAWRVVKRSAVEVGTPSSSAVAAFKAAVTRVVEMSSGQCQDESLGGYQPWEHLDNPDNGDADQRWGAKKGVLAGYIADSKAYIKDCLVKAVDAARTEKGLGAAGTGIDNWNGVEKPAGYGTPKSSAWSATGNVTPVTNARDPIAKDAADHARKAGATSDPVSTTGFARAAEPLGRATHSIEDFFAHSNFIELAKQLKTTGKVSGTLKTGTFNMPDKAHALGGKLGALADGFLRDYELLQKIYGRKQGAARARDREAYNAATGALKMDSWTTIGEMSDVVTAATAVADSVGGSGGTLDVGDFLVDRHFLKALKTKGQLLEAQGEQNTSEDGHAKLAKDAPGEPHKDHAGALRLAIEADRMVVGPLKQIMKMEDAAQAHAKLQEQLALLDRIIAPPEAGHPLLPFVTIDSSK